MRTRSRLSLSRLIMTGIVVLLIAAVPAMAATGVTGPAPDPGSPGADIRVAEPGTGVGSAGDLPAGAPAPAPTLRPTSLTRGRAVPLGVPAGIHTLPSGALALGGEFGQWSTTIVDKSTENNRIKGNGLYTSLVIGSDGTPHISYYSPGWGGVRYATRSLGGTWTSVTIGGSRDTFRTSIDLDPATGYPSFTYSDSDPNIGDLKYAYYNGSQWFTEYIDRPVTGGDCRRIGMWNSFRFGPDGTAHVAYGHAIKNVKLVYATRENGTWNNKVDVDTDDAGYEPSLAFNAAGQPVIAYRSMAYAPSLAYWVGSLRLAERDANGHWKVTTVDDAQNWGDTGYFPSLALDSQGNPHISYQNRNPHDAGNNGLRYVSRDSSGKWTGETAVKGGTDLGMWTSLVLDASGRPYISYEDHSLKQLKIATRLNANEWTTSVVDKEGEVGACTSLALDPEGYPAVSYMDDSHHALKYAEWQ